VTILSVAESCLAWDDEITRDPKVAFTDEIQKKKNKKRRMLLASSEVGKVLSLDVKAGWSFQ
jgi:hypothetical protein